MDIHFQYLLFSDFGYMGGYPQSPMVNTAHIGSMLHQPIVQVIVTYLYYETTMNTIIYLNPFISSSPDILWFVDF